MQRDEDIREWRPQWNEPDTLGAIRPGHMDHLSAQAEKILSGIHQIGQALSDFNLINRIKTAN